MVFLFLFFFGGGGGHFGLRNLQVFDFAKESFKGDDQCFKRVLVGCFRFKRSHSDVYGRTSSNCHYGSVQFHEI